MSAMASVLFLSHGQKLIKTSRLYELFNKEQKESSVVTYRIGPKGYSVSKVELMYKVKIHC